MDAAAWDERYRATGRLWSEGPNLFVDDRLSGVTNGVGLDLASGEGRNAIWLAERGWQMTAVDFSDVAVERGRSRSEAVEFISADVRSWEPAQCFDLVLIAYLHLVAAEFEPLVRRSVSWLLPGGELFMIGHDGSNIARGVGGPQTLEILWDVDEIVAWLTDLEIIESGVVERPVDVDGATALARDALVRARAARE
ncbi:MAG TPA: class I SAM-dependent methyltransferase [Acidimicrobiia bacterium]|nr:class I SAM-dependent methyltransferase [Acidimicrobiia bacterium]